MAVRPIDANELYRIEKLLDTDIVRKDKVALNLLEQVLYDIQHVPTLTPPNEWVSVYDRLPEADRTFTHDKSVLVYVPENKKMLHHGIYEGKLVTDEIDGERVTDWMLWGWPYIDRERPFVTHWMPLPEPPEVSDH